MVVVLNRPRHQRLLREIRDAGARVKLIPDGDISAGLWAAMEQRTGIDVLWGIGGAPEGVLAACAVKAVGGGMQGRLAPRDEGERAVMRAEGKDTGVLTLDDLCAGENVFFAATGVTEGHLLQGVRIAGRGQMSTHSVVMRSYSGTIRYIEATHDLARLQARAPIAPAGGGL
jgi:fructose-1,6-bisphosphatase II